jgi:3-oxoacyl-[acyl-carrier protein] reductase
MDPRRTVAGRVAIITGAASGIGRATALAFAEDGAAVGLIDRSDAVSDVAAEIAGAGGTAASVAVDLADPAAPAAAVGVLREQLGPVDVLVNAAGVSVLAPIDHPDWEDAWDVTLAVNLAAPPRMVRACLADLERDSEGRVVNIASTEGLGATRFLSPYTASKHGVIGLTRSLAVELARRGVNVTCVCPGPINTGMTSIIPDEAKATFAKRRVPMGRYGEPEEVAHMILSLALPVSSFATGSVLVVDGGMTSQVG